MSNSSIQFLNDLKGNFILWHVCMQSKDWINFQHLRNISTKKNGSYLKMKKGETKERNILLFIVVT